MLLFILCCIVAWWLFCTESGNKAIVGICILIFSGILFVSACVAIGLFQLAA